MKSKNKFFIYLLAILFPYYIYGASTTNVNSSSISNLHENALYIDIFNITQPTTSDSEAQSVIIFQAKNGDILATCNIDNYVNLAISDCNLSPNVTLTQLMQRMTLGIKIEKESNIQQLNKCYETYSNQLNTLIKELKYFSSHSHIHKHVYHH